MNNLPKFIALEKLLQNIKHGKVDLEFLLREGKIVGIATTGSKKTVYNQSDKDINTNEVALEYILKRITQQLESGVASELLFKITNERSTIKSVVVESKQTIK